MTELVCKKLRKGKSADIIAEELEEELNRVRHICQVAKAFAPEYDPDRIVEKLFSSDCHKV